MSATTPALLLACAAALLVPAGAALSLQGDQTAVAGSLVNGLPAVGDAVNVTGQTVLGPVTGVQLQVHAKASATSDASTLEATTTAPSMAPSLAREAAHVAAPVAGSAALGLLLAALALGAQGVQAIHARILGWLGRLGRGVVGSFAGVAMFSRLERGTLLDNPVRVQVHDAIAQDPGLSLSGVSARAGIAWGTTVHHLRRMESHGLVVSVTQSGQRRFFLANTPAAQQRVAVSAVLHPTARRIAQLVSQRPGIDQSGICAALGLNNPAASKHLTHFESRGLVLGIRTGRNRHYHATGDLHSALQIVERTSPSAPLQAPPLLHGLAAGAC